jgi:L-amino acid N-acyltransferase YncA
MRRRTSTEDAARLTERVTLGNGDHVLIRPLREQDRSSVVALFAGLTPESLAQRFLSAGVRITPAVIDHVTAGRVLVATRDERVVALASFHPQHDPTLADTAIVVADAEQRRGIGTALFQRLMRDAWCAGIRQLRAEVSGTNYGMRALLRALDLPMTYGYARGEITVEVDLSAGQHEMPDCDEMYAA